MVTSIAKYILQVMIFFFSDKRFPEAKGITALSSDKQQNTQMLTLRSVEPFPFHRKGDNRLKIAKNNKASMKVLLFLCAHPPLCLLL